ncbi:hypothetical protein KAU45_06710 [bacterium]|nr:hypothetical protein [bacterium]
MRNLLSILLFLLMVSVSAESAVEALAYPTPWSFGEGDLTLRIIFNKGFKPLASKEITPVFIVCDMSGYEVISLSGELTGTVSEDGFSLIYEAVWDGRNADGRLVAPGTYICYVEGVPDAAVFRFIVKR